LPYSAFTCFGSGSGWRVASEAVMERSTAAVCYPKKSDHFIMRRENEGYFGENMVLKLRDENCFGDQMVLKKGDKMFQHLQL
jgi:hypothetical protein